MNDKFEKFWMEAVMTYLILVFVWRNWRTLWKTAVRKVADLAKISTRHLLNKSLGHYRY